MKKLLHKFIKGMASVLPYVLLVVIMYVVINWWRQPIMPASPNLTLTTHQGEIIDIDALSQNSPVLVYFWGSWCGVCSLTSPKINQLAKQSDYPVVTIAIKSGDDATLSAYLDEHDFEFVTINDADGSIFADWQGQVTPSYVVLENGEMTQGLTGIQPKWSLNLRLWLASQF